MARESLVMRRRAILRKKWRTRILIALLVALALFPPMWAVYLVAWLVWRSRPRQRSMRRVKKGVRSLEKNRTGPALKELQDAHLIDPSNPDALYWLGLLLSHQERHDEAEEALSIVARRIPGLPEIESALVDAYLAQGDPETALHHAQRLFDLEPHAPASLVKLSEAFEALGRVDMAIQALQQAPLSARLPSPGLLEVHYRLAELYLTEGDRDLALEHFKRIYARDISFRDVRSRVEELEP
jgi:tetratricopeptide (TPR) repeat protein